MGIEVVEIEKEIVIEKSVIETPALTESLPGTSMIVTEETETGTTGEMTVIIEIGPGIDTEMRTEVNMSVMIGIDMIEKDHVIDMLGTEKDHVIDVMGIEKDHVIDI